MIHVFYFSLLPPSKFICDLTNSDLNDCDNVKEFYHRLSATKYQPPRIFGMTASPVKAKGIQIKSIHSIHSHRV